MQWCMISRNSAQSQAAAVIKPLCSTHTVSVVPESSLQELCRFTTTCNCAQCARAPAKAGDVSHAIRGPRLWNTRAHSNILIQVSPGAKSVITTKASTARCACVSAPKATVRDKCDDCAQRHDRGRDRYSVTASMQMALPSLDCARFGRLPLGRAACCAAPTGTKICL